MKKPQGCRGLPTQCADVAIDIVGSTHVHPHHGVTDGHLEVRWGVEIRTGFHHHSRHATGIVFRHHIGSAFAHEQGNVSCGLLLVGVVVLTTRGGRAIRVNGPVGTVPCGTVRSRSRANRVSIFKLMTRVGAILANHAEEVHDVVAAVVKGDLVVAIAVHSTSGSTGQIRGKPVCCSESIGVVGDVNTTAIVERPEVGEADLASLGCSAVIGPPFQIPAGQVYRRS